MGTDSLMPNGLYRCNQCGEDHPLEEFYPRWSVCHTCEEFNANYDPDEYYDEDEEEDND